jgi:hypothetical protein
VQHSTGGRTSRDATCAQCRWVLHGRQRLREGVGLLALRLLAGCGTTRTVHDGVVRSGLCVGVQYDTWRYRC